jgi:hypothetical protein
MQHALALQTREELRAATHWWLAIRAPPTEQSADTARQLVPRRPRVRGHEPLDAPLLATPDRRPAKHHGATCLACPPRMNAAHPLLSGTSTVCAPAENYNLNDSRSLHDFAAALLGASHPLACR